MSPNALQKRIPTSDNDVLGPARLVVLRGDRPGRQYVIEAERVVIGRALDCDLRFDLAQLSRHHAAIHRDQRTYAVEDLGSSNGTFVNGTPVESLTPVAVGDKIQLGTGLVLQLALQDAVHEELSQRQRLEMLGRLGAGIAHDFNNMLGAVLSNVEVLQQLGRGVLLSDEEVKETLSDIHLAASRAAELSRRLVAFARGRSSGATVIDVTDICHEVARLLARTFPRGITIETEVGEKLRIAGEPLELHQVLMNLCLNARDAMGNDGVLRVSAKHDRRGPNHEIVIAVTDDGEGMDEATKRRIFEPFFTTKRERGFGLGLATVREVVTYLGGRISVSTAPGVGTTFELRFPGVAPDAHRHATSESADGLPNTAELEPLSILLVDDEDMVRRSTHRVLRRAGHDVEPARGGEHALALLEERARPFDLVILDLDMPDMNGEEMLERLAIDAPGTHVMMLTGHHDESRELNMLQMGAQVILHKPCSPNELLEGIAKTMTMVPAGVPAPSNDDDASHP